MPRIDVYSVCHPLYDIQAEVSDGLLGQLGFVKGGSYLVDHEVQRALVTLVYDHIVNAEAGGSGANTAIGVVQLGGSAAFAGHVGDDEHGRLYAEGLRTRRVKASLGVSPTETGICLVLVTPDAQRTLVTFLGASTHLSARDLDVADLARSSFLYLTSYLFSENGPMPAILAALEVAKEHDVRIALALCDAGLAERLREPLADFCKHQADVVIGNEAECCAITETASADEAACALSEGCAAGILPLEAEQVVKGKMPLTRGPIVAVTLGAQGALIGELGKVSLVRPVSIGAVDRTGAGDMFSAGLLFGLSRGWSATDSAHLAVRAAARVVEHLGARLPVCEDLSHLAQPTALDAAW